MSGRNHAPPLPLKGVPPHGRLPPPAVMLDGRGLGPMPAHLALLEEIRESQIGIDPRRLPPHPAMIEDGLAVQHQEIQHLLADNQRLAATHVALKQELEAAHHELQRMAHFADSLHAEKDVQMRDLYDKSTRVEADLRGVEAMRNEIHVVHADIKELSGVKQDLMGRAQAMTQELVRFKADLQQVPALKAEIESMKQELQAARAAIEYEKKGYAENYEHGVAMEKKLVTMARELEKLRAEIANADKRGHAAPVVSAVANPAAAYSNYGNPEAGFVGHQYPAGYGMPQMQANTESYPQYGAGAGAGAGVGVGSWGAYDMQRAQGHR